MCWGPKEADVIGKIERTLKWREEVSFKKKRAIKNVFYLRSKLVTGKSRTTGPKSVSNKKNKGMLSK